MALPEQVSDAQSFGLHPALLDAALHGAAFLGDQAAIGLPATWHGACLHAIGAAMIRVRLTPDGRARCASRPSTSRARR